MAIQVGDRVLDREGDEMVVLAVSGRQAWCQMEGGDCWTVHFADLTPIEPEALLTNAQLAQVLEEVARAWAAPGAVCVYLDTRIDELRRQA